MFTRAEHVWIKHIMDRLSSCHTVQGFLAFQLHVHIDQSECKIFAF